jgi:hypothetical protein
MIQLDEKILAHIEREGWSTPRLMAQEPGFPSYKGVISDRCKLLRYAGFIDPIHGEMYDITVEGRLYLDGEIDARHQPYPKASAVFERWSFPPSWTVAPRRSRI